MAKLPKTPVFPKDGMRPHVEDSETGHEGPLPYFDHPQQSTELHDPEAFRIIESTPEEELVSGVDTD